MCFSLGAKFLFKFFAFHNTTLVTACHDYPAPAIRVFIEYCNLLRDLYLAQQEIGQEGERTVSNAEPSIDYRGARAANLVHDSVFVDLWNWSVLRDEGSLANQHADVHFLGAINLIRFLALRRTLIFFVFIFQLLLGRAQYSYPYIVSILLITLGAIVAGFEHFNDEYRGYALVIANNMLSALGLHVAKELNLKKNIGPMELVFNNSLNLFPIMLILSIISADL